MSTDFRSDLSSQAALKNIALSGRISFATGSIAAIIYILTMNRTIGFMDSGEVAAVASTLGIMHPTGYPTLTILGWLITTIIPLREILVLNIFAALLAGAGIGVLALLFDHIFVSSGIFPSSIESIGKQSQIQKTDVAARERAIVAALSALTVGFSGIWWEQATGFEVYALQALLLPLVSLLFLRFVDTARNEQLSNNTQRFFSKEGMWFALTLGLAFTNHLMTIFLAPAFIVYYFWSLGINLRAFLRLLLLIPPFIVGLLPYLYLPIRASMQPQFNWGNPDTWDRFIAHVSGESFREWMFSGTEVFKAQTHYFLDRLPSEFAYVGIAIAVTGLIILAIRNIRLMVLSLLMFLTCLALAGNYRIYDIELYYTIAVFATGIWIAVGSGWLLKRFGTTVGIGVTAILAIAALILHYPQSDLSGNQLEEDYVNNILLTAPPNTLIFSSNAAIFVTGAWYMQAVEHLRPDVTVINHDYLSNTWYLDKLEHQQPQMMKSISKEVTEFRTAMENEDDSDPSSYLNMLSAYDQVVQGMIDWQMTRGTVLIVGEMERAFGNNYAAIPWQLGYRLTADTGYLAQPFPSYRFEHWDHIDPFTANIYEEYGRRLSYRASYEYEHGNDSLAGAYLTYALTFDPGIDIATIEELPLDAMSQIQATADFYTKLRERSKKQ